MLQTNQEIVAITSASNNTSGGGGGVTLNKEKLSCPKCACLIFKANSATLSKRVERKLLSIAKETEGQLQAVDSFWSVDDMMKFENIGFSRSAGDGLKYLICADCDLGPLGFTDPNELPSVYYIAVSRVK